MDIGVLVTTIPPRAKLLQRATESVFAQTLRSTQLYVQLDADRSGAAVNKTRGLAHMSTEWTAFLDDDDYFLPTHLEELSQHADGYDVVYCAPLVIDAFGNKIPLLKEWGNFGQDFDPNYLRKQSYIGMFSMVRTELAKEVGGFNQSGDLEYDDWAFFLAMLDAGARFKHVPIQTYVWTHVPNIGNTGLGNTSGKADQW